MIAEVAKQLRGLYTELDGASTAHCKDVRFREALEGLGITPHANNAAYTFPWLTAEECLALQSEFSTEEYEVNDDEPVDAQIPEIVLEYHCPELHNAIATKFNAELVPIVAALTGHKLDEFASIQLAKYSPAGVACGTWHTDLDSDVTVTVALNDDYEGGGLLIADGGLFGEVHEIPKQPTGTASVFLGRTAYHMGLPVTAGTRDLLVIWCRI